MAVHHAVMAAVSVAVKIVEVIHAHHAVTVHQAKAVARVVMDLLARVAVHVVTAHRVKIVTSAADLAVSATVMMHARSVIGWRSPVTSKSSSNLKTNLPKL